MRIETIVKDTIDLLSPYVTSLSNAKEQSGYQATMFETPNKIWEQIKPLFHRESSVEKIVEDFIKEPNNEIVQAIFRHQLSTLLKKDTKLVIQLEQLLYHKA